MSGWDQEYDLAHLDTPTRPSSAPSPTVALSFGIVLGVGVFGVVSFLDWLAGRVWV